MATILQEKIAGMTEQQANKLARELQEYCELSKHPEVSLSDFPLLSWLTKAIKLEGSVAEQIHLCPPCRANNHKGHTLAYKDVDQKYWMCRCRCTEWRDRS